MYITDYTGILANQRELVFPVLMFKCDNPVKEHEEDSQAVIMTYSFGYPRCVKN